MVKNKNLQTRRSTLKAIGGGIAGSALLGSSLPQIASGEVHVYPGDEGTTWLNWVAADYKWDVNDRQYYEIDSGLSLLGAGPGVATGWETEMHMMSYMAARRYPDTGNPKDDGNPVNVIDGTWTGFEDDGNGENLSIIYSDDSKWVGGNPTPQFEAVEAIGSSLEIIAEDVITYASATLGALKNFSTIDDRLSYEYNRHTTNSGTNEAKEWGWWYNGSTGAWAGFQPSDPENWFRFKTQQSYGTLGGFRTWGRFVDSGIWSNPTLTVFFNITTHAPEGGTALSSSDSGSTDQIVDTMSKKERKEWGMKLKTPSQLKSLGVNPNQYRKTSDGRIWWSTTPKVSIGSSTTVTDDAKGNHRVEVTK